MLKNSNFHTFNFCLEIYGRTPQLFSPWPILDDGRTEKNFFFLYYNETPTPLYVNVLSNSHFTCQQQESIQMPSNSPLLFLKNLPHPLKFTWKIDIFNHFHPTTGTQTAGNNVQNTLFSNGKLSKLLQNHRERLRITVKCCTISIQRTVPMQPALGHRTLEVWIGSNACSHA